MTTRPKTHVEQADGDCDKTNTRRSDKRIQTQQGALSFLGGLKNT